MEIFLLDISWISKEILGDLWIYWLDIRLDVNWISKEICIGDLLDIKGDIKEIFGHLYWIFYWI